MFGECTAFFIFMGPDSAQCSTKRRLWILKPNNFVIRSFTEENLVFLNQKSVWICLFEFYDRTTVNVVTDLRVSALVW